VAAAAALPSDTIPSDYTLRSEANAAALSKRFEDHVEPIATDEAGDGDVLLVRAGTGQHHFVVIVENGFVHADARLGKVVERPGSLPWPALAAWRLKGLD
jgi:hypothetical protein